MAPDTPLDTLREWLDPVPAGAEGIVLVEEIGRVVDAARIRVASSMDAATAESLGFASPVAAVATLARVTERTARTRLAVAGVTQSTRTLTGATVPPRLPALAASLESVGLDAAELVARELATVEAHVDPATLEAAEELMVGLACGVDSSGRALAPVSVTALAAELRQIAATIDPDGARPREERAIRRRSFRVGAQDQDGLVPVTGRLMPEVGGLLLGLLEAHRRSPRFVDSSDTSEFVDAADGPTPEQRRHDVFADIVVAATRAEGAPTLDGMPVTVVVTTTAAALADPAGRAGDPIGTLAGSAHPLSRAAVERLIDHGGLRLVRIAADGSIAGLSTPQRCFTAAQRLQLAARDGYGCASPGCTSPHYALQAHHVVPWREGGPTHVNNGIHPQYAPGFRIPNLRGVVKPISSHRAVR